jgi:hypothetical protein
MEEFIMTKENEKYIKYTKALVMSTKEVPFGSLDIGNLFFVDSSCDTLLVKLSSFDDNNPKKDRNCGVFCAVDPGMCGLVLFLEDEELVYVSEDSTVTLKGYLDL